MHTRQKVIVDQETNPLAAGPTTELHPTERRGSIARRWRRGNKKLSRDRLNILSRSPNATAALLPPLLQVA